MPISFIVSEQTLSELRQTISEEEISIIVENAERSYLKNFASFKKAIKALDEEKRKLSENNPTEADWMKYDDLSYEIQILASAKKKEKIEAA